MDFEREPQRQVPPEKERPTLKPKAKTRPFQARPAKTLLPFERNYAQEVAVVMGGILILAGLIGFVMDNFLGAHLSYAHNVIHVVSGGLAVWFGFDSVLNAKRFNYTFGVIYGLLGLLGFFIGTTGIPSVGATAQDSFLWRLIPGTLELGTVDHILHLIFAAVFILGAAVTLKRTKTV
ncbi:MAG: DUF4383 domain-containing protein [Bdellovibrio sp.]